MKLGHWVAAIDPGTSESAFLLLDTKEMRVRTCSFASNEKILNEVYVLADASMEATQPGALVIERMENFGNIVGRDILETAEWSGRFYQNYWTHSGGHEPHWLPRRQVKMHLCGTMRATDAHVRQALLDIWGDRKRALGKKSAPGPLYGVAGHLWSALALAVTYHQCRGLAAVPKLRTA